MQESSKDEVYLRHAIALAKKGVQNKDGGPFGAVIVRHGDVIAEGNNMVTSTNDPTAHAEIVAIRRACETLLSFQLTDCVLYSSCEPCPMCLGAIYWSRLSRLVFACTREDAADIDFDDAFLYKEIVQPVNLRAIQTEQMLREEGLEAFRMWENFADKIAY
ncbi:MAG: nucleoside deaminase [Deltaproteobacteria bacterium]|nr:nucleoside deaminase [Deltaproteobacteria bacterium]